MPLFSDFENTDYFKQFPWRNYLDLFNIARNSNEFEKEFYNILEPSNFSEEFIQKSTELYRKCFDDTTGKAIEKYSETILNIINQHKIN